MYHDEENGEKLPINKFIDDFDPGPRFVLIFIIFLLCIFFAPSKQKDQPLVKPLTKKMQSLVRIKEVALLPGEGSISLPTDEYLNKLEKVCRTSVLKEERRPECNYRLGQIKEGRDDVMSRINPIYGRPPFTTEQFAYVRQSEFRIMQLLQGFEYWFVQT